MIIVNWKLTRRSTSGRWTSISPHRGSTNCSDRKSSRSPSSELHCPALSYTSLLIGSRIYGLGSAVGGHSEGSIDLQAYGVNYLPPRSRLQMGLLEDVDDLEDAGAMLSREDRLLTFLLPQVCPNHYVSSRNDRDKLELSNDSSCNLLSFSD